MPKGKAKMNSSDNLPPPQTRSLRSKRRESPSDESSLTDDVRTTLGQKDTGDDSGAAAVSLKHPLQECSVIIKQHHQAVGVSCLPEQDGLTKGKGTETTSVKVSNEADAGREETDPSGDSQLETGGVNTDTDTKKNGDNMEETASEECNGSHQSSADQLQVSKDDDDDDDDDESSAVEEQMLEKIKSNLEKNQYKPCTSDVKESTAGSPAKKKRRTCACGQAEKGRSHFSQIQTPEVWQNGAEGAEKQICNKTALEEEIPAASSSPQHVSAERSEAEPAPQSSHQPAETEVQGAASTSDGISTLPVLGSSEGNAFEAERVSPPGPEPTDNLESHQHAEEEEEHLGNQQLQEHKESTAQNGAEKLTKTGGGKSAEVNLSSAIRSQMEESGNEEATEADALRMRSENGTGDDRKGRVTGDGVEEAVSSAEGGVVTLGEASLTPSVHEGKTNCDPEDDPAPGSSAERADDTFGPGCFDYVSDSQLNAIVLLDEKTTENDEADLSVGLEDATNLICGLIRELSSLNRKVMVAHRKVENLRRKNPRSFSR
ncbi:transcriptional regulator ATRX-like [Kryptolebias marmoratus]|uniref:transcriptional regulator ATRX-like n=1 Tax=Kryptolebias marmoratus TaxID=37003 RepID=UPI000D530F7F|nr:transcriptional regulator ATRX-like [Kryptolebias marmoratus]